MRLTLALVAALVLSGSAQAQQIRGSAVSGTLVSRSVTIPAGDLAGELLTVPNRAPAGKAMLLQNGRLRQIVLRFFTEIAPFVDFSVILS